MKHRVIAIVTFLSLGAATAGAQARPTSGTVTRPAVNPSVAQTIARPGALNTSGTSGSSTTAFMASGPYQLALHAQKKNGQPVNVSDFVVQTGVTRSGSAVTITSGDMTLTGTVSGNQLHASGSSTTGGTLTLAGSASANGSAGGTFTSADGGVTRTGTFTLYPGLSMGPNNTAKIRNYGDPKPGSGTDGGDTCGFWCNFFKWL